MGSGNKIEDVSIFESLDAHFTLENMNKIFDFGCVLPGTQTPILNFRDVVLNENTYLYMHLNSTIIHSRL